MPQRSSRSGDRARRTSSRQTISSDYGRGESRYESGSRSRSRRNVGTVGSDDRLRRARGAQLSDQRFRGQDAYGRNASRSGSRGSSRGRSSRNLDVSQKGGYPLRNRPINFTKSRSNHDTTFMVVVGIIIALLVILVITLISCAASCGQDTNDPTSNISQSLEGDLRTQVEQVVTSDFQSTFVAEHADQYPVELIQLMVNEPASTSFVYNYPTAAHGASSYDESVSRGTAPLLYTWDPRWGYTDYAGSLLAVTGSGPTALAMARMGLLGQTDQTPATLASFITQMGGATGETHMDANVIIGAVPGGTVTHVDEDGDGYDDNTGDYIENTGDATQAPTQGSFASTIGLNATAITAEPGIAITDTMMGALGQGANILIQTSGGAFGTTPHWVVIVAQNSDGSVAVYDPTSTSNSLHSWDPSTVVNDASTIISLTAPAGTGDQPVHVDEDGDGYDDTTGEYLDN